MKIPTYKQRAHFIDDANDKVVSMGYISHVPRVGDEVRMEGPTYYKVIAVVWVYDEPCERVNIGLERVK